jgi:hypothetical protein
MILQMFLCKARLETCTEFLKTGPLSVSSMTFGVMSVPMSKTFTESSDGCGDTERKYIQNT